MPNLTTTLADTVTTVGARAAYGDPVELGDATIVPVALACYGFGAGESGSEGEAGSGGGGYGYAAPIGAYVTRAEGTRFEPNIIALLAVGVPFLWVAGRALARVVKALKK